MPHAVIHILFPLVLMSFIRDYYVFQKGKKKFTLHYVLIAGLAGLLPDIDVAIYWLVHRFGFEFSSIHRTFAHTIFVPLLFLLLFIVLKDMNIRKLGRHKMHLGYVFLMISFGTLTHLFLDGIFSGHLMPLYPFSTVSVGLNLVGYFSYPLNVLFLPSLEAVLFFCWLIYLEVRHRISDFI